MSYALSERNAEKVKIYYEDIGSPEKPVIVMQHGDGNDSQDWKTLGYVEKLSPHYRLILIDYLGFGKSDKLYTPEAYTIPLLASDTIAVLKHLGITKDAVFFGGSMGGRIGYELASNPDFASYFKAFIINGNGPSKLELVTYFADWAKNGGMENVVAEMQKITVSPFPEAVKATFLNNDPKAYIAANTNPWPSSKEKLQLIDKPVQLICGEKSDERVDMEEAAKLISQAEIHIIPNQDHCQAYWNSEAVVPLMKDFIKLYS